MTYYLVSLTDLYPLLIYFLASVFTFLCVFAAWFLARYHWHKKLDPLMGVDYDD